MALLTAQSIVAAGTTPSAITPSASDTISASDIGERGCVLRVITTGTASNITIQDPGTTALGNAGTEVAIAAPATGARMVLIPKAAVDAATGLATVTSSSQTGMTYELYRL